MGRMFNFSIVLIGSLFVSGFAPNLAFAQKTYELDNTHSSLVFAVSHLGLSYTYGRFNECAGEVTLNNGKPSDSVFAFEINVDSIDTNQLQRDEHLRSAEFFDADNHPKITFKSTSVKFVEVPYTEGEVEKKKTMFELTGDMTMLGTTKSIVMPLQLIAVGKGQDGNDRCGFFGKFVVKRSDFGMDAMKNMIGDQIAITFSFEAKEKVEQEETNTEPKVDPNLKSGEFDTAPGDIPDEAEEPSSPFDAFGGGGL